MNRAGVLVVTSAVVLAVAGCGGDGGEQSPDALVRASIEATGSLESFHFTFDSENVPVGGGLQLTGAEGDALVPDRVAADVTGSFGGLPIQTRIVAIGDEVWLENPLSGRWTRVDVGTTPQALLDPARGVLAVLEQVSGLAEDGTETVGNADAVRLTGAAPAEAVAPLVAVAPGDGVTDVTIWIGSDDSLLRRIRVEGAVAAGEPETAVRVVEISRFDQPVTIEPPEVAP
ncbi:MAG: LppX_LprAFG lipoprotein [Thermoleophilia bacterium]|nr:LppX_LprAFG lipoprotein [Thermoleophilia bacterium]MDH5332916.1 LppX_LprAFG lipoprotein [Thermoleophilia bacterium]